MFDALKILGSLVGGGGLSSGSGSNILKSVLGAATSDSKSGGSGGLGSLLGGVFKGSQGTPNQVRADC